MQRPTIVRDRNIRPVNEILFNNFGGWFMTYDASNPDEIPNQTSSKVIAKLETVANNGEIVFPYAPFIFWFNFPLVLKDWNIARLHFNCINTAFSTDFQGLNTQWGVKVTPVLIPFNPDLTYNLINAWTEGNEIGIATEYLKQFNSVNNTFDSGDLEEDVISFEMHTHKKSETEMAPECYGIRFDLIDAEDLGSTDEGLRYSMSFDFRQTFWYRYPNLHDPKPRLIAKVLKMEEKIVGQNFSGLAYIFTLDIDPMEYRLFCGCYLDIRNRVRNSGFGLDIEEGALRGFCGVYRYEDPETEERVPYKVECTPMLPYPAARNKPEIEITGYLYFYS